VHTPGLPCPTEKCVSWPARAGASWGARGLGALGGSAGPTPDSGSVGAKW